MIVLGVLFRYHIYILIIILFLCVNLHMPVIKVRTLAQLMSNIRGAHCLELYLEVALKRAACVSRSQ